MGQTGRAFPAAYSWRQYVEALCEEHGSMAEVARLLADESGRDPETERRALRRLARGQGGGGAIQSPLLRRFGLPRSVHSWLKWMGQYHSRFADLPTVICLDYLTLWDRPPVIDEPRARLWLLLAMANVLLRRGENQHAAQKLTDAQTVLPRVDDSAGHLELTLKLAYVCAIRADHSAEGDHLRRAEELVDNAGSDLTRADVLCCRARCLDQVAHRLERSSGPNEGVYDAMLERYQTIPDATGIPFVAYRRAVGTAYCLWKLKRRDVALTAIRAATDHAADGGYTRLRAQALGLHAAIVGRDTPHGRELERRAKCVAKALEDVEMLARLHASGPTSPASTV